MTNKLLFFSYDFPPLDGGISRLCDEIVKQFLKHSWNVEVLSIKSEVEEGFTQTNYPVKRVSKQRGLRELLSFIELLKYPKSTLIMTGVWNPEALLAMLAGHKNVVILAHGNDIMKGKDTVKNKILYMLRKWVLEKAKLVICNSYYTQSVIKEQFQNVNTTVCTLGVDAQRFIPNENKEEIRKQLNLPTDKKIILTISRINKYKAHDTVLKALALLNHKIRSQICYCITGRGNYLEQLKLLAKELNVYECILWYGFIEEKNLTKIYQASDLFVLCTREEKEIKAVEGFGLVFLEAQACGIPVLGSNQGGIPDAVKDGEGGWIIKRDDSESLAHYLEKLVDDDIPFKLEGKKARERVEKETTWDHFSHQVLHEINNIKGI